MTRPTIRVQVDKGTAAQIPRAATYRLRSGARPGARGLQVGPRSVPAGTQPVVTVDVDRDQVLVKGSSTSVNAYARGPQGVPGPTAVSTDPGNAIVLGTDGLVYTTPAIKVGTTAPANPRAYETLWVDTR